MGQGRTLKGKYSPRSLTLWLLGTVEQMIGKIKEKDAKKMLEIVRC